MRRGERSNKAVQGKKQQHNNMLNMCSNDTYTQIISKNVKATERNVPLNATNLVYATNKNKAILRLCKIDNNPVFVYEMEINRLKCKGYIFGTNNPIKNRLNVCKAAVAASAMAWMR